MNKRGFMSTIIALTVLLTLIYPGTTVLADDEQNNDTSVTSSYREVWDMNGKTVSYEMPDEYVQNESITNSVTTPDGIVFDTSTGTIIGYTGSGTTLAIPSSINGITVAHIGNCAFAIEDELTSVTIPDSVISIGREAFVFCDGLVSIDIPSSVSSFGEGPFKGCALLESINVAAGNPDFCSDGGVLFNKTKTEIVQFPAGSSTVNYTIPSSVTSVRKNAFGYCDKLESVAIPSSVTDLGEGPFMGCYDLESFDVEASNPYYCTVGGIIFNKTQTALIRYPAGKDATTYTIPGSVTEIGIAAFAHSFLVNVVIPDSVSSIGSDAFWNNYFLDSVTIPENVNSILDYTFAYCHSMSRANIPSTVTSISSSAFNGCENLTIYGAEGSYAQTYANDNGIPFQLLISVTYCTHVQNIGWQDWVSDGETAGTEGYGYRLEGIKIEIDGVSGGIQYKTHVQNIGWQGWVYDGAMSGTEGIAYRLEAIEIQLYGEIESQYDVYYRVHAQNFGWLDWAKNGAPAGTAGYGYRLEAIQIELVEKGGAAPGSTTIPYRDSSKTGTWVTYRTHVQDVGWQDWVSDGAMSGTEGQALRLEGINIMANGAEGSIQYKTHVQNIGWQDWVSDGELSGTTGLAYRLEAIQIELTGTVASQYDVYYRVHAQNFGWMDWACNGGSSGTAGFGYRLEGINIVLVEKGGAAPGPTDTPFISSS